MAAAERNYGTLRKHPSLWQYVGLMDILITILTLSLVLSAAAVVYTKHLNRRLFAELQMEQQARDALHVEWSQLLLEQGAWASNARIERISREQLNMEIPSPESIIVVTR